MLQPVQKVDQKLRRLRLCSEGFCYCKQGLGCPSRQSFQCRFCCQLSVWWLSALYLKLMLWTFGCMWSISSISEGTLKRQKRSKTAHSSRTILKNLMAPDTDQIRPMMPPWSNRFQQPRWISLDQVVGSPMREHLHVFVHGHRILCEAELIWALSWLWNMLKLELSRVQIVPCCDRTGSVLCSTVFAFAESLPVNFSAFSEATPQMEAAVLGSGMEWNKSLVLVVLKFRPPCGFGSGSGVVLLFRK